MSDEPLPVDFAAIEAALADMSVEGQVRFAASARAWVPLLVDEVKRARGEAAGQAPEYRLVTNGKRFRLEVQVAKDETFIPLLPPFDDEEQARKALEARRAQQAEVWTPVPDKADAGVVVVAR